MRPGNEGDYAAQARHYAKRRAWVDKIKMERGCADCGYNAHPAALDFDHRDPAAKRLNMAANLSRRLVVLEAEIAKCDVVCANCHRIRTSNAVADGRLAVGRPRSSVPLGPRLELGTD